MRSIKEFASTLTRETKWHGNHDVNGKYLILNAGKLSLVYENGSLRYISIGKEEIIRMIYSVVRIKNWITIAPEIIREKTEIHADSFKIIFNCIYKKEDLNFSAEYTIEGRNDNSLLLTMEGEALSSFEKNRIGFCVLHPIIGNAGNNCIIEHPERVTETSVFPLSISPHQPFTNIISMKWKVSDQNVSLVFTGEVFETEDHRNWTDASYKTYCTPLTRKYPVRMEKGEKIFQKIELKVEGNLPDTNPAKFGETVFITVDTRKTIQLPSIGIGQSTRLFPLSENELSTIKKIKYDHYRVDLYLFLDDWKTKAELAAEEALRLEYPVELAVFFDENYAVQVSVFMKWIVKSQIPLSRITIFHRTLSFTPPELTELIIPLLKRALPGIRTGAGTNANFAQLNRNRPDPMHLDYLSYSIHPQEHANDNTTLTENLQAQSYTVESAGKFTGGIGIWISPVNITRRFNANSENYENPDKPEGYPPQVDSRLMSLYGACWTAGSLKYLIESGAAGITYFETAGERGIIQGDSPSRWPEKFKTVAGMIFPIYFVFRFILQNKEFRVMKSGSSDPLKVASLILTDGKELKFLLINFTSSFHKVIVNNVSLLSDLKIIQLDSISFADAVSESGWLENAKHCMVKQEHPLLLSPFSVTFVEAYFNI